MLSDGSTYRHYRNISATPILSRVPGSNSYALLFLSCAFSVYDYQPAGSSVFQDYHLCLPPSGAWSGDVMVSVFVRWFVCSFAYYACCIFSKSTGSIFIKSGRDAQPLSQFSPLTLEKATSKIAVKIAVLKIYL